MAQKRGKQPVSNPNVPVKGPRDAARTGGLPPQKQLPKQNGVAQPRKKR